jgi:hypothetical protein
MTDRETLEQLIDRAEVMLMSRSHPPNAENLAADLDERTQLGYDLLAALRAAPAPPDVIEDLVVALRSLAYAAMTSGGTKGPDVALKDAIRWATDALQKYDKWRAAPAPEGETPCPCNRNVCVSTHRFSGKYQCRMFAPASPGPTPDQFAGAPASSVSREPAAQHPVSSGIEGEGVQRATPCGTKNDQRVPSDMTPGPTPSMLCLPDDCSTPDLCRGIGCQAIYAKQQPPEPGPTPEGRETERKAIEAEIGEPVVFIDEAAIYLKGYRAAQAETRREVRETVERVFRAEDYDESLDIFVRVMAALTGGTEEP